ncbi:hypothetical protein [Motilibacter peucedani]|uniref:hypothetical protein n=1 Tax=Motilibacter peucedani TaxID=598650 RepID=UPI000EB2767E|nr:hypothetical protein [Motilibacter peucedani]
MSVGSSTADKDPLVKDDKVTLDLTQRPTRASLHLRDGEQGSSAAAADSSKGIDVTVLLPGGGSTRITAYRLAILAAGGPKAEPSELVVNAKFHSREELGKALWAQQSVLRLDQDALTRTAGPEPGSTDGAGPGSGLGVVQGLQQDFLTLDVDVRDGAESGTILANYDFAFDLPLSGSATPSASTG